MSSSITRKKMPSPTWNYFTRLAPGTAKCNLCDRKFNFKSCVSNLTRHLILKHQICIGQRGKKPTYTLDRQIKVRKLIELVKEQSCLWDENSSNFANKEIIAKTWSTIASIMLPDMDPVIAAGKLSERFCILKEHFLSDKLRSGNNSLFQDSVYYNQLQFLNSFGNSVSTSCTATQTEDAEKQVMYLKLGETLQQTWAKHSANTEEHPSRQEENDAETYPQMEAMQMDRKPEYENPPQCSLQVNNVDKNVLFFLSIADDLRRVPADARKHLKSDLMTVMMKLVQKYRYIAFESSEN